MKKIIKENGRTQVLTVNDKPPRVQAHFEPSQNIVNIMKKYHNRINQVPRSMSGFYGDFSNCGSYLDARMNVINTQNLFDSLPSNIRRRFNNDPALLLEFLDDRNNLDEAIKLGIVDPPNVPAKNNDDILINDDKKPVT